MPKPVRGVSRFALGAVAALALVFGSLTAPAYADDAPVETPVIETVVPAPIADDAVTPETGAAPLEEAGEVEAPEVAEPTEGAEPSEAVAPSEEPVPSERPEAVEAIAALSFGISAVEDAVVPTVSPATGVSRDGQAVTVSGVNYAGTPIYVQVCEDRPLSEVSFAMLSDGTCLSTSFAKQVTKTPSSGTQILMAEDGSFSFEFTIPAAAAAFEHPAVFTMRNHTGMADRTQDSKAAFEFAAASGTPGGDPESGDPGAGDPGSEPEEPATPGAAPSVSASPSTLSLAGANTIAVSGSGYTGPGAANGVYVAIGTTSTWQPGQVPSEGGWVTLAWVSPGQLTAGSFSTSLTLPAGHSPPVRPMASRPSPRMAWPSPTVASTAGSRSASVLGSRRRLDWSSPVRLGPRRSRRRQPPV